MKEVTEWNNNPRMMWVWDNVDEKPKKKFVIYIQPKCYSPVIALYAPYSNNTNTFKHCAEIEEQKTRRMTHQELAWWLQDGKHREWRYKASTIIYNSMIYSEGEKNKLVDKDIQIRENGGEWHEPLVEVEE